MIKTPNFEKAEHKDWSNKWYFKFHDSDEVFEEINHYSTPSYFVFGRIRLHDGEGKQTFIRFYVEEK